LLGLLLRVAILTRRPWARQDAPFSQVAMATEYFMVVPSLLVRSSRSSLDQSKRARVKEHRLSENTMGLVCRLPRAQGL